MDRCMLERSRQEKGDQSLLSFGKPSASIYLPVNAMGASDIMLRLGGCVDGLQRYRQPPGFRHGGPARTRRHPSFVIRRSP